MVLLFIDKMEIQKHYLPAKIDGNYWFSHEKDNDIALNIEAKDNEWIIKNEDIKNLNDNVIKEHNFYNLEFKDGKSLLVYCEPDYDTTFNHFIVNTTAEINVGSGSNNQIIFKNEYIKEKAFKLDFNNGTWNVECLDNSCSLYVNNKQTMKNRLAPGDIVFCSGLKIIIISNLILINNPGEKVVFDTKVVIPTVVKESVLNETDLEKEEEGKPLYKKEDYFLRSPRFKFKVEKATVKIDTPPARENQEKTPIALTIGPMLTMGMTSMLTGWTAINSLTQENAEFKDALPSLIISLAMLCAIILWPIISRGYEKRRRKKKEAKRQEKYGKYIDGKKREIEDIIEAQKQNILNNNLTTERCQNIILTRDKRLWERRIDEEDFLNVRIGLGTTDADIEIAFPEKGFSMEEDDLLTKASELINMSKQIKDIPLCAPLTEKYVSAVVGENALVDKFLKELIVKISALHSYTDLKIVLLTNEQNSKKWDFLKVLPHCWSDNKSRRYFATNTNEIQQVSNYLQEIFNKRKYKSDASELEVSEADYHSYNTYYLIITDDLKASRNSKFFKDIVSEKINYGFSTLIKNDQFNNLPSECSLFIEINDQQSGVFENEVTEGSQKVFNADVKSNVNVEQCARALSNIPIEMSVNSNKIPSIVSFLEMYNVGKVEQLNILERWKVNNPIQSLKAPVGIDEAGELFNLDLHEKFHGPHGLIAGMTGSGKSEFIITFILSLAINYHPHEVSIILIDYKGGGIAGAFENANTGTYLPHLAGSITNLDTVEMKRSLASIQSELKRRQRIFNAARKLTGESTIDIYKYQRLYREGQVKEPVPHLFIISDEFAELKVQQPEFMDQLISAARIGRSLGVHLILATQKPSGVVNDQIWSNSKFRVCLKVQDKSDSMEMLKRAEAATIKTVGRFYLQVGYNELFMLGQSAWAGAKYIPKDKVRKKVDTSIEIIDNTGYVIKHVENKRDIVTKSQGDELTNVVKYLSNIAKRENAYTSKLWLERIANEIFIENLAKKYSYVYKPYSINPIIGEYDDPANQKQGLLTIDLLNEGNILIYGSAGSGKELLLTSMIYNIITNHTAEEINMYILDFGAETLRNFSEAPHVGDVLSVNDEEKIINLLKMLRKQIDERKDLFRNFNGSYSFYNSKNEKKLPMILVIINYFEAFMETYEDYEEELLQLLREGLKYGIVFVTTVLGNTSMRYKFTQNFKQELVLQLNEEDDYSVIIGAPRGMVPSKTKGRGLVRKGGVFEFQTAYPTKKEELSELLRALSLKLKETSKVFVKSIPILPEKINQNILKDKLTSISRLPIGVEKESLELATCNLKSQFTTIVSGQDLSNMGTFVRSMINEVEIINKDNIIVIDTHNLLDEKSIKPANLHNKDFDTAIKKVISVIESSDTENKYTVCYIVGIIKLLSSLSDQTKNDFIKALDKARDINKISFVLIDTVTNLKQVEYESWYKAMSTNASSIWVGDGIANQFTIKISKTTRKLREEVGNEFGYFVKNGNPKLIKLIDLDIQKEPIIQIESL